MQSQPKQPDCELINPWPPLIHKFHYDFDFDNIKEEIYKFIDYTREVNGNSALEEGNAFSTATNYFAGPHTWEMFSPFVRWLEDKKQIVWNNLRYPQGEHNRIGPKASWVNVHNHGGTTLEHAHGYTELVVTCYLNLPENGGFIEYRDPLEWHKINTPAGEDEPFVAVPCKTNDVLIFPGWLKHRTQPNKSTEDRIVLTINMM